MALCVGCADFEALGIDDTCLATTGSGPIWGTICFGGCGTTDVIFDEFELLLPCTMVSVVLLDCLVYLSKSFFSSTISALQILQWPLLAFKFGLNFALYSLLLFGRVRCCTSSL